MNFLSDNMVYRRGQDYLRRRRSRTRNAKDEQQDALAGDDNELDASSTRPTLGQHTRRRTSLSNPLEGGESADDEGEPTVPIQDEDTVAWKHTDRALNARLSRQEQLEREKGVIEDALRSSLSTLMMLQPGSSISTLERQQESAHNASRSPPSLSTSPSSTLTLRGARSKDPAPRSASTARPLTPAGERASQSMYTTRSVSRSPAQLMERRKTYTSATVSASRLGTVNANARARQSGEEPDWTDASAHISSASSFEDLGKRNSTQEGSDLDMDFSSSTGEEKEATSTNSNVLSRTSSSNRLSGSSGSPRRRRRPRPVRMSSLRRTAVTGRATQDGVQSDPEGRGPRDRTADDSFLELLEATKTFMAMNPRYSSTPKSSTIGGATSTTGIITRSMPAPFLQHDSTPRGRILALFGECDVDLESERTDEHSPAPPVSMSASTNFDLSSSDSPPSHGLTSSRGGDDVSQQDYDNDQQNPPPQPIVSDPRLSSDASRELATPRETREPEKPTPRPLSESWLEWLNRQVRRVTVGIGLVGIGLVLAVGVGLFKTTTIRRKLHFRDFSLSDPSVA